mgnify:CR=1 FL=1
MRERLYSLILTLALCTVSSFEAYAQRNLVKPRMTRVYMFGFGASFIDSVSCQTQLQQIDSAWMDAHGMLADRSLYSLQLQSYMEQTKGVKSPVCTVFFGKKESKMQKLWAKVKRRYEGVQNLIHEVLPADSFRLVAEEYRPIIITEEPEKRDGVKFQVELPTVGDVIEGAVQSGVDAALKQADKKASKTRQEIRKGKKQ